MKASEYRQQALAGTTKRNKYGAVAAFRCLECGAANMSRDQPCVACGADKKHVNRFDSKAEARRYDELRQMQTLAQIHSLRLQPSFDLIVCGEKVGVYRADFSYRTISTDHWIVEDIKGGKATDTPLSKLKRKVLHATTGISVQIVER